MLPSHGRCGPERVRQYLAQQPSLPLRCLLNPPPILQSVAAITRAAHWAFIPTLVRTSTSSGIADPVHGIQIEALKSVGTLGERDPTAAAAVASSGVIDSIVLAQTHDQPKIKARP